MSDTRDGLLTERAVRFGVRAADREAAVRACGDLLVEIGAVGPEYVQAMLLREKEISTYVGEGVAIPHATHAGRAHVRRDALAVVRFAEPVDWADGARAELCVAIAAVGEGHLDILAELAAVLVDPGRAAALRAAPDAAEIVRLLRPEDDTEAGADGRPDQADQADQAARTDATDATHATDEHHRHDTDEREIEKSV